MHDDGRIKPHNVLVDHEGRVRPDALFVFVPAGKSATALIKGFGDLGLAHAGRAQQAGHRGGDRSAAAHQNMAAGERGHRSRPVGQQPLLRERLQDREQVALRLSARGPAGQPMGQPGGLLRLDAQPHEPLFGGDQHPASLR